jgi:hypothetical protein
MVVAHLKVGCKAQNLRWWRARRRTQSKKGKAIKRISWDGWGLNSPLKKRWLRDTDLKQCIMINMHVYLPEKYRFPFLYGVFIFSKVWVSDSKLWWLFRSCLLELYLVILTFKRDQHTCLPLNLYLKGCQLCIISHVFLEGESWSQPYVFCWIAP